MFGGLVTISLSVAHEPEVVLLGGQPDRPDASRPNQPCCLGSGAVRVPFCRA